MESKVRTYRPGHQCLLSLGSHCPRAFPLQGSLASWDGETGLRQHLPSVLHHTAPGLTSRVDKSAEMGIEILPSSVFDSFPTLSPQTYTQRLTPPQP